MRTSASRVFDVKKKLEVVCAAMNRVRKPHRAFNARPAPSHFNSHSVQDAKKELATSPAARGRWGVREEEKEVLLPPSRCTR